MPQTRTRRCFESLESRHMLAGNVVAEVTDGLLSIEGDARENWIEIRQLSESEFLVLGVDSPLPGTEGEFAPTAINGLTAQVFSGVEDFSVKLRGEDDFVFFNGDTSQGAPGAIDISGSVLVEGNHGYDNILFEDTTIRGKTRVRGNDGGDTIQFLDCTLVSIANIRGQGQGDTIGIFRTTFRDDAIIVGGNGPDRFFIGLQQGQLEGANFRQNVFLHGGRNRDFIEFTDTRVIGNATILGGAQKDDLDFNDSVFKGDTKINSGSGKDIIELNDTRFLGATNSLLIHASGGIDKIRIFDSLFQTTDFTIRGGSGNDTLRINTSDFAIEPELLEFLGGPGLLDILDVGLDLGGFSTDGNGNNFPGGFSQFGWEELV